MVKKSPLFFFWTLFLIGISLLFPNAVSAQSVSDITPLSTTVAVFEKYELHFNVSTVANNLFFQYEENPPPGVMARVGITVMGVFTTPSGKILNQPAFYNTEVSHTGSGDSISFTETNKKYWVIRFSPQEVGIYKVAIFVKDSSGETSTQVGTFTATPAIKDGFIKVSSQDSRYFEFSNGKIYWPIGPAWGNDYSNWQGTGLNLERPWMGGVGAYSANWARWISSAEELGNEGFMSRLNWREHYSGHELSYELTYPSGFHIWLATWMNDKFAQKLKSNTKYKIKFTAKTSGITGPRNSLYPYGLVAKIHCGGSYDWPIDFTDPDSTDSQYRNCQEVVPHVSTNRDWFIYEGEITTASSTYNDISIYLDNVSAGSAYIDEFSMKEVLSDGSLGGELIRNPSADIHTYVDPRGAAFIDWQVQEGEVNGIFFKYVVHDKNDWIQNHLSDSTGSFTDSGSGYYQAENTKASWLLRQWYRYIIARWGYSTAIHSWELNNEGSPNDPEHWRAAQEFAKFMHDNDSHPHLVTTSFWCCWRPAFWGNEALYPDIDYADIHEYTYTHEVCERDISNDMAEWNYQTGKIAFSDQIGKPIMRAETGITGSGYTPVDALKTDNPGIWYHNLLWVQLNEAAMFDPNYWFSDHFNYIDREMISRPFYLFIKDTDFNKGGYSQAEASSSNSSIRIYGQKNINKGKAYLWIQNLDHTWRKYMDGVRTSPSGTVTLSLSANTQYDIEWWNTYSGVVSKRETLISDSQGKLSLAVSALSDDVALKIIKTGSVEPSPTVNYTPGDINEDGVVNIQDYILLSNVFGSSNTDADINSDGIVNIQDYVILSNNFGKT